MHDSPVSRSPDSVSARMGIRTTVIRPHRDIVRECDRVGAQFAAGHESEGDGFLGGLCAAMQLSPGLMLRGIAATTDALVSTSTATLRCVSKHVAPRVGPPHPSRRIHASQLTCVDAPQGEGGDRNGSGVGSAARRRYATSSSISVSRSGMSTIASWPHGNS